MFHPIDLYKLAPQISLTLLALVVMAVDLFVKRRVVTIAVALIGLIIPLGFVLAQQFDPQFNTGGPPVTAFFGMFIVDKYALFFDLIFLIIAAVVILSS